jgi:hypothetical protein
VQQQHQYRRSSRVIMAALLISRQRIVIAVPQQLLHWGLHHICIPTAGVHQ